MDVAGISKVMLKLFVILLLPSFCLAYPELLTKRCSSCHSEASGFGILKAEAKPHEFEIKTPAWLLLGAKADLNQTFTKSPYEKTGSFKATRAEAQLGLVHEIDSYLNIQAQGSLNRVEPNSKSDSITDYVYSPYRFIELTYNDPAKSATSIKHGFYRNELQSYLSTMQQSFLQTEVIYSQDLHQVNLGYKTKSKFYNKANDEEIGFINYQYFSPGEINFLLGHEQKNQYQLSSLAVVLPKNEKLTFITALSQSITSGVKGFRGRITPVYQHTETLKFYGFAEYANSNIQTAKPRTIIYGLGSDYLWFSQGLLSVIYSKTDDSVLVNNPVEKLELNFHLYM